MVKKKSTKISAINVEAWGIAKKDLEKLAGNNSLNLAGRVELISCFQQGTVPDSFSMFTIKKAAGRSKSNSSSPEIFEKEYRCVGKIKMDDETYFLIQRSCVTLHRPGESDAYNDYLRRLNEAEQHG